MTFSEEIIQQVWDNARSTFEQDASVWRLDECGAWMRREHYGHANSEFGWKIERISIGKSEGAGHLRAFQWGNVFDREAQRSKCHVTADRTGQKPWEHAGEPRNRSA